MVIDEQERKVLLGVVSEPVTNEHTEFPSSAGDRERRKFRRSETPGLVTVAVVDDNGKPIGTALVPDLNAVIKAIDNLRLALTMQGAAADLSDSDLEED